ncbi:hypothetical protein NIES2135_53520 [Leptolyngbya boryana NIES-2135]|jgi:hypothetical protein|uniref:Uncharacterized protein n=1 Tax=Leptolyngbya boryana NIES-2135 TaxID=1973484 RepID=A0A1Z4JP34_LEPBY|nr:MULTISPECIES: hypothetical protein [Leptolyngbya]BAY58479.1 hypothetical protein NIES2135_53520 [Leptolyngbya boryana NIES-2135]MBD2370953.1 hypothetical protein [Leptolyngbya sp. FACHB-161]MBD2377467.1 hypothetical protein [Leptolyngbya sp. FACHB-238]MBD2401875.1 hypothetical protein [Leptolyngbya sp. FACHB-239]MBD2408393.1 hypothetical protein [Leptolyngbya sp. FACHB-402]
MNRKTLHYKVTIEEVCEVEYETSDWAVVSEEDGKKNYGYQPRRTEVKVQTGEIFTQQVKELDLSKVVLAVNGLPGIEKQE